MGGTLFLGPQSRASFRRCRSPLARSPLARGPPADCGFEKQLPVNKCEQKFGPIFKVMSYAENMFLQTGGTAHSWCSGIRRVYK